MIADSQGKRQCVFYHHGITADLSLLPDSAILVNTRVGTNVGTVLNDYMTCESRCVGHNHAVANNAVMRNVGLGHKQTIVADLRLHATARRAAMNSHKFANVVAAADAPANPYFRR